MTRYSYTALDLVKKVNYNGAKEVSYQYNKVGELVQMDDWTGTNTFELDLLGRLQKMTDHKGNTVSYTYDSLGNLTYETGVGSHNCDYIYNNLNQQIDRSSDNWKSHTTSAYDKRGNLILEEYIKNSLSKLIVIVKL